VRLHAGIAIITIPFDEITEPTLELCLLASVGFAYFRPPDPMRAHVAERDRRAAVVLRSSDRRIVAPQIWAPDQRFFKKLKHFPAIATLRQAG
jgi:hypothetical protein